MRLRSALVVAVGVMTGVVTAPGIAFADESVSAHLSSSNPTALQQLTIDGDVSGASTSESMITATRTDSSGTNAITGTTTTQGHFQLTDKPPVKGQVVYHITADGGPSTDVTVQVAGAGPGLTIHVSPAPADVQRTVHVVAHLGSATTNRDLTLYATPYGGSRQEFDSGPVDANGDRTADRVVHRRTTFTAVFAGDSTYAAATVRQKLHVRGVLAERLKGWFRSSGGAKIYHHTDNPVLAVHLLPEHKGTCLYFRAQHRHHGKWVRSAVSTCVKTDGTGRAIGVLKGDHIVGVPYRLRAEWHGTKAVDGRNGAWMHLEFR
jgi:hypothetical protein